MKNPALALFPHEASKRLSNAGELAAGAVKLALLRMADCSAFLPLRARYFLTAAAFFLAWLIVSAKRRAVRNNLRLILEREPRRREILRVFLEYGRYYAECADLAGFWRTNKILMHGFDILQTESSFLGLTFHLGNFEIFGLVFQRILKTDYTVVAERLKPEFLADYFSAKRRRYHLRTIPHDDLRAIIRRLEKGSPIGVVCDRLVAGRGVRTHLFGKSVHLPLSIVGIALRRRIPIYVAYCARENRVMNIFFRRLDPAQSFEATVDTIVAILETAIRKYPYQWHVLSEI